MINQPGYIQREFDDRGLRYSYDYVIFDGNWLLFRNMFILSQGNSKVVSLNDNIKLFIQSIFKPIREWSESGYTLGKKKIIILWDKSPYHKTKYISEYKADRKYDSEEEIDELKEQLSPESELDQEEIDEIKDKIKKLENSKENFKSANFAKYAMIKNLDNSILQFCIKDGYEADDLLYHISQRLLCNKETGIAFSSDTDWVHMTNEYMDFYSLKTGKQYREEIDNWKNINKELYRYGIQLDLYSFGVLKELHCESHNGIDLYCNLHKDIDFYSFVDRLFHGDVNLPEYESMLNRYNAMHIGRGVQFSYTDDIASCIEDTFAEREIDKQKLSKYLIDNNINVGSNCLKVISNLEAK